MGVVALTAAVIGATVLTGGTAAVVIGAIGWTAAATSTAISGVGAFNDCTHAIDENCAFSVASTVIGLSGFRFGSLWPRRHGPRNAYLIPVEQSEGSRGEGQTFLGPVIDIVNYERKYC